jgi:hypothetical protein
MGLWRIVALTAVVAGLSGPALAQQNNAEAGKNEAAVKGAWKNPAGGTCEAAYFKAGELNKTVRGEAGMKVTVVNAGMTIEGTFILAGAREGQVVNPMTDKMIFLLEPQEGNKLHVMPLGEPVLALNWPEVVLDLCPGSR